MVTTYDTQLHEGNDTEEMTKVRQTPVRIITPASAPLLDGDYKSLTSIKGWPIKPGQIKHGKAMYVSKLLLDFTLLACAIAFLAFALMVCRYDQASTSQHPQATAMLESATKYGPTVFPILFASITGRASHSILQWRLEKGDRIGMLDSLAASTSLTNAFMSQFQLRGISATGLILLVIWAVSPLAGQASIRQMAISTRIETQNATFYYMSYNGALDGFQSGYLGSAYGMASSIFGSALLASDASKSPPLDPWGNIKIPKIEHFEGHSVADEEGWFDTRQANASTYASLVGVPFTGAESISFVDYSFSMHVPYMQVQCTRNTSVRQRTDFPTNIYNASGPGADVYWSTDSEDRYCVHPNETEPFRFTYWPWFSNTSIAMACSVTATYVELDISCAASSTCNARRTRRSRVQQLPSSWTLLDTNFPAGVEKNLPDGWSLALAGFMYTAWTQSRSGEASLIDKYLINPDSVVSRTASTTWCEIDDCSKNMGQLLNTQIMCMNGLYAIPRGLNEDTAYYWDSYIKFIGEYIYPSPIVAPNLENRTGPFYNYSRDEDPFKARAWPSQGTRSTRIEIIVAHKVWVITLCIASVLLIFLSLVSPVVRYTLINGPELIMNLSSLGTRNNNLIDVPDTGTYLGPAERARLLKDVKVRFGSVARCTDTGDVVGGLAIASLHDDEVVPVERIRKRGLYN